MDNTLDYTDQASFLGLRALGHGPVVQYTWIYGHDLDLVALRRFHRNLGSGILGRRIERSPLPFGRHRWIAWAGPPDVVLSTAARPRSELAAWVDEQAALPIDPEFGPSWRLAVQPFAGGDTAVTLVVSHTIADGVGIAVSVTDAAKGLTRDLGYPNGRSRPKRQVLLEDSRRTLRAIPEMTRALNSAVRVARSNDAPAPPGRRKAVAVGEDPREMVTVPSVTAYLDANQWDERAESLGGTSNSMLMGLVTRLGMRLDWLEEDGAVTLSIPVSERTARDTRGNALTAVRVTAYPAEVTGDLRGVRAALKAALSTQGEERNQLVGPLPLVPVVPKAVARRFEGLVVGGRLIGSSNLGLLDPAVNCPDGTDADYFYVRLREQIDRAHLRRHRGVFFPVLSARVKGQVSISVGHTNAAGSTTTGQLSDAVRGALGDFGLSGHVE